MTRSNKALTLLIMTTMGLWGCAKGPANGTVERLKSMEIQLGRVEDDFRTAALARDQLNAKVTLLEKQKSELQKDLEGLRAQLQSRTVERDSVQVQFDQFRGNLRSLLGQADAAVTASNPRPVTEARLTSNIKKS